MNRSIPGAAIVATLLAMTSGCAVMTVDVDVYKGPFINHEDIQREQVTALAMGAKPLLRELLVRTRDTQCFDAWKLSGKGFTAATTDIWHKQYAKDKDLCNGLEDLRREANLSKKAVVLTGAPLRVYQLLSLYSNRSTWKLSDSTLSLLEGIRMQQRAYGIAFGKLVASRRVCDSLGLREVDSEGDQVFRQEAVKGGKRMVRREESTSRQWVRVLEKSSDDNDKRCLELSNEVYAPIDNIVKAMLVHLANENDFRDLEKQPALHSALTDGLTTLLDMDSIRAAAFNYGTGSQVAAIMELLNLVGAKEASPLSVSERAEVRGELLKRLKEKNGSLIASQLQVLDRAGKPGIALYPTIGKQKEGGVSPEELKDLLPEKVEDIEYIATGDLEGGRDPIGLESLVNDYLVASQKSFEDSGGRRQKNLNGGCSQDSECTQAAARLQRSLVHFAQKLLTLSDFDVLLQDDDKREARNYVQVLQGVGTAILSLSDDLERRGDYHKRINNPELGTLQAQALLTSNSVAHRKLEELKAGFEGVAATIISEDPESEVKTVRDALERGTEGLTTASAGMSDLTRRIEGILKSDRDRQERVKGSSIDPTKPEALTSEQKEILGCGDEAACTEVQIKSALQTLKERISNREKILQELSRMQSNIAALDSREPLPVSRAELDALIVKENFGPKRVMQLLVETLRFELAAELRSSGESPAAQRIRRTIAAVQQQAQRYSDLRPAVSYLRNSLPASVLQDDSSLMWKNLLQEHMRRGSIFTPEGSERGRIQAAIDKQYWHSVNRIRVSSGMGANLNYVLARDDIGNWYVKSYTADASKTFRSAMNLAMYAAAQKPGGTTDSGLLRAVKSRTAVDRKGTPQDGGGESESAASSVLKRYDESYGKKLLGLCTELAETLKSLRSKSYAAAHGAITEDPAAFEEKVGKDSNVDADYFPEPPVVKEGAKPCDVVSGDMKAASSVRRAAIGRLHADNAAQLTAVQDYLTDVSIRLERINKVAGVVQARDGLLRYRKQVMGGALKRLQAWDEARDGDLRFSGGMAGVPANP